MATPIDRVDIVKDKAGYVVTKYRRCEVVGDTYTYAIAAPTYTVPEGEFDYEGALEWLREHGYTVREWPGISEYGIPAGARAWRGAPTVIRDRQRIIAMRRRLEQAAADWVRRNPDRPSPSLWGAAYELAYDL